MIPAKRFHAPTSQVHSQATGALACSSRPEAGPAFHAIQGNQPLLDKLVVRPVDATSSTEKSFVCLKILKESLKLLELRAYEKWTSKLRSLAWPTVGPVPMLVGKFLVTQRYWDILGSYGSKYFSTNIFLKNDMFLGNPLRTSPPQRSCSSAMAMDFKHLHSMGCWVG